MPRATLELVAARAGVSRQTVSNVLNSPQLVAAETAERVRAAIEELDYRPHLAARQLRTRRSHVLGLRVPPVVDGINGAVLDRFLHAVTEQAQERGYRILLYAAPDVDEVEIAQYDELLETADLDGFVLNNIRLGDTRTSWLTERGVPFVTFGRPWGAQGAHPWVDVDGAAGVRLATEHLLGLGHRRIALLGWPQDDVVGTDRRRGWVDAMTAAGWTEDQLLGMQTLQRDGVEVGVSATHRLLADVGPTAIVAVSDSLALGASVALRAVADPPAVIGFDDTPVAAAVDLSSVAQPLVEAAEHAVSLLLSRLDGDGTHLVEQHRLLTPHLVVRGSSRPPAR
ncbi:MAG: LacI family transcriptional regulator [Actinobacteria bacterium]|nr:LacI family transcriptional regulator [Actinomycetota bacterium]MCG2802479.1 LacI family transcriptional regulator [Cellulomonas sp.]